MTGDVDAGPAQVEAWVTAAAGGDEDAWARLVERFGGLLWSITRSYRLGGADASDAFQLTWLRLLERLDTIESRASVGAWLGTTCRRECLAILRRSGRAQPMDDAALDRLTEPVGGADEPALTRARDRTLWDAFARLPARCQTLLRLLVADVQGSVPHYAAVAAALDMPVGSLGPTRRRCLENLRRMLPADGI